MELTELDCNTPALAAEVVIYLRRQLAQEEDAPKVETSIKGSKVTIKYEMIGCDVWRKEFDAMLIGFRDGYIQAQDR